MILIDLVQINLDIQRLYHVSIFKKVMFSKASQNNPLRRAMLFEKNLRTGGVDVDVHILYHFYQSREKMPQCSEMTIMIFGSLVGMYAQRAQVYSGTCEMMAAMRSRETT